MTPRSVASATPAPTADAALADRGTALVGTLVGFGIFMAFLLFAVQTLVHLYATSMVTMAATSAAESVADAGGDTGAEAPAVRAAKDSLGGWGGRHVQFEWLEVDASRVRLEVVAESPGLVPLSGSYRLIERTVTVRTERFDASG